jgi:putative transposase
VHGRIYQTLDELREAVRNFVASYNAGWLIKKTAYAIGATLEPPGTTPS